MIYLLKDMQDAKEEWTTDFSRDNVVYELEIAVGWCNCIRLRERMGQRTSGGTKADSLSKNFVINKTRNGIIVARRIRIKRESES